MSRIDVRAETGIETYVNDEMGDLNPGVIVDSTENRGRALTPQQTRALAADLLDHAAYAEGQPEERVGIHLTRDQVEAWIGHKLTDDQVGEIEECIPNSSIPDAIETIAHEALSIPYEEST